MTGDANVAIQALNRRYFLDHPVAAAMELEKLAPPEAIALLTEYPVSTTLPAWRALAPNAAAELAPSLPGAFAKELLSELPPNEALQLLGLLEESESDRLIALLDPAIEQELRALMIYPPDTAGRLMDTRFQVLRDTQTVREALDMLRQSPSKSTRSLYLIDAANRLTSKAAISDIAVSTPDVALKDIAQPIAASVDPFAPQSEIADTLEQFKVADLPVINVDGTLLGVVYHSTLLDSVHADAVADMQAMVGASREERALSSPWFAVRKRMPWLQINLLTAFLAAAVVGLFQSTIAKYTALAVLLPVVAGQSGNAGAQALAVTLRGLALREISVRSWPTVVTKEVAAGLLNGLAIAVTCGLAVFIWSWSIGLVLIIMSSMIIAMVVAGFAGALTPIVLTKIGQDPAQSSSIVLTTVTDVAGFFAFLGIATLLSGMLVAQ